MESIQRKADQNGYATIVAPALLVHEFHLPAKPNCHKTYLQASNFIAHRGKTEAIVSAKSNLIQLIELPIIKSEMDKGYRAAVRLNASLSYTFIIFVLIAKLRLVGSCALLSETANQ